MNIKLLAKVLSICLVLTVFVQADETSHKEAAYELMKTMGIEKILSQSNEKMVAYQVSKNPKIKGYEDVLQNFYDKYSNWDVIKNEVLKMYTDAFTEKELNELTAFYKSPTGQKALSEMPALMVNTIGLGQKNIERNLSELQAEIEKRKAEKKN